MDSLGSPYQVQKPLTGFHPPPTQNPSVRSSPPRHTVQTVRPFITQRSSRICHGSVRLLCIIDSDNSEPTTKEQTSNRNSSILTYWESFPSPNNGLWKLGMIHVRCALSGDFGRYERNYLFVSHAGSRVSTKGRGLFTRGGDTPLQPFLPIQSLRALARERSVRGPRRSGDTTGKTD